MVHRQVFDITIIVYLDRSVSNESVIAKITNGDSIELSSNSTMLRFTFTDMSTGSYTINVYGNVYSRKTLNITVVDKDVIETTNLYATEFDYYTVSVQSNSVTDTNGQVHIPNITVMKDGVTIDSFSGTNKSYNGIKRNTYIQVRVSNKFGERYDGRLINGASQSVSIYVSSAYG